jgi:hypothetical protein
LVMYFAFQHLYNKFWLQKHIAIHMQVFPCANGESSSTHIRARMHHPCNLHVYFPSTNHLTKKRKHRIVCHNFWFILLMFWWCTSHFKTYIISSGFRNILPSTCKYFLVQMEKALAHTFEHECTTPVTYMF